MKYRIPPFKRPRGRYIDIILSISAWKKIILGA